jgi:DNA-binding NarL/FixJ family response regulator
MLAVHQREGSQLASRAGGQLAPGRCGAKRVAQRALLAEGGTVGRRQGAKLRASMRTWLAMPGNDGQPPMRLTIVEDEALFLDLLSSSLGRMPGIAIVGTFQDFKSALEAIPSLAPDAVLLDIDLRGENGVELGLALRRALPQLAVVLLSNHRDPLYLAGVPRDDIAGWSYLLKRSVRNLEVVHRTLLGALDGLVVLDPEIAGRGHAHREGLGHLGDRQLELLRLVAQGFSNAGIAAELGISEKSVQNQLTVLYHAIAIDTSSGTSNPRVRATLAYLDANCP